MQMHDYDMIQVEAVPAFVFRSYSFWGWSINSLYPFVAGSWAFPYCHARPFPRKDTTAGEMPAEDKLGGAGILCWGTLQYTNILEKHHAR